MKRLKHTIVPAAAALVLLGGAVSVLAFPFGQGQGRGDSFQGRMGPPHGRPDHGRMGGGMGGQHGPPPHHHGQRGGLGANEDRLRELGVSDEQIAGVRELEHGAALARVDLRAAVEKAELMLRHAMHATDVDEEAVMDAVEALNDARGAMFKQDTLHRINIKRTLGDDVLKALRPSGQRRCGRQGGGDRPPPPPQNPAPESE